MMWRMTLMGALALSGCRSYFITQADGDAVGLSACKNSSEKYHGDVDADADGHFKSLEWDSLGLTDAELLRICEAVVDLDGSDNCFCYLEGTQSDDDDGVCSEGAIRFCANDEDDAPEDCDDDNPTVFPGANECDYKGDGMAGDGIDNDCDGYIDEDFIEYETWYENGDGDSFGGIVAAQYDVCNPPTEIGLTKVNGDCDDANSLVYPDAEDVRCGDNIDYNCDGEVKDCVLFQTVGLSALTAPIKPSEFEYATVAVALGNLNSEGGADFALGYPLDSLVQVYYGVSGASPSEGDKISGSGGFGSSLAVGSFPQDPDATQFFEGLAVGSPYQINIDQNGDPSLGIGRVGVYKIQGAVAGSEYTYFTRAEDAEESFALGTVINSVLQGGEGLAIAFSKKSELSEGDIEYSWYVWLRAKIYSSADKCNPTGGDVCFGGFKTADGWPLALASATFGSTTDSTTYIGVGASSGVSGTDPGLAVYDVSADDFSATSVPKLRLLDEPGTSAALGAAVAFGTLSDDTSLVLVGAPGDGSVYMLEGVLSGTVFVYDVSGAGTFDYHRPHWTTTVTNGGSAIAFIGDIDRDGDEEIAVGGEGTVWIIAQKDATFPKGPLDDSFVASGIITGFTGTVRHIVNAGDVNADGYSDLLVSTDSATYLIYGGYTTRAQDDASDTGGE